MLCGLNTWSGLCLDFSILSIICSLFPWRTCCCALSISLSCCCASSPDLNLSPRPSCRDLPDVSSVVCDGVVLFGTSNYCSYVMELHFSATSLNLTSEPRETNCIITDLLSVFSENSIWIPSK